MLFKELQKLSDYPIKVKPVKKMPNITTFLPRGRGLWLEHKSTVLPSILILDQDFSTIKAYEAIVAENKEVLDLPTWKNLIKLINEAGLDLYKCLFLNVFMGLRNLDGMMRKFLRVKEKGLCK